MKNLFQVAGGHVLYRSPLEGLKQYRNWEGGILDADVSNVSISF